MDLPWPVVLFDLDGTLSDAGPGITRCIHHALVVRGIPAPPPEALGWAVGPSLRGSFARLAGTDDPVVLDALIAAYRERFVPVGMFENTLYPGIAALLADCTAAGLTLGLATLKPGVYARRIIDHFGLREHFSAVIGSYLDGRRASKARIIATAISRLGARPDAVVMVGDRAEDLTAAACCGVSAIGAGWGYSAPDELEEARPLAVCRDVAALALRLMPCNHPVSPCPGP